MGENPQVLLFGYPLNGPNDHILVDRIKEVLQHRNTKGIDSAKFLKDCAINNIKQFIVGPDYLGFLFKDGNIGRVPYGIEKVKIENKNKKDGDTDSGNLANSSGNGSANNAGGNNNPLSFGSDSAASRNARLRRVMMSARRGGRGIFIERTRPMLPASAIPEEMIAQAQVVLQGKSREVIIRELQRTNLNVNEAVNNLLSRDEDEDYDEMADAYLPEELLSLIDAGFPEVQAALEGDGLGDNAFDYFMGAALNRRRIERVERRENRDSATPEVTQDTFTIKSGLSFWGGEAGKFPKGVKKFVKIVTLQTHMIALADNGMMYNWNWKDATIGDMEPSSISEKIKKDAKENAIIVDIEACAWRCTVYLSNNKVATYVDEQYSGKRLSDKLYIPPISLPEGESFVSMRCSSLFSVIQTTNSLYWFGLVPFQDRRKIYEKSKIKTTKSPEDTHKEEIVVGSEIVTKTSPLYAAGSIGINFSSGVPQIGILQEDAWTLTEHCRFKVVPFQDYDKYTDEELSKENKGSVDLSIRKRAAPSDEAVSSGNQSSIGSSYKEMAWSVNETVFLKEEATKTTAVVHIVDKELIGVVFNHTKNIANNLSVIRLLNKDDVVLYNPEHNTRSPQAFQRQLTKIPLSSSYFKKLQTYMCDSQHIRMLIEKRGKVNLIRLSVFGKVLSEHILPICPDALNSTPEKSTSLLNYGEEGWVTLTDSQGQLVPLVRNYVNGFREPIFLPFSTGTLTSVGCKYDVDKAYTTRVMHSVPETMKDAKWTEKNSSGTRMGIIAIIMSCSPDRAQPVIEPLMDAILCCNLELVKKSLNELSVCIDDDIIRTEILKSRTGGNKNIFHAAVMGAFALNNKDQMDKDVADLPSSMASMVDKSKKHDEDSMDVDDSSLKTINKTVSCLKERQSNSIEIIKLLCADPNIGKYFSELFSMKDISGMTPFMLAIHHKAYSAALTIWETIEKVFHKNSKNSFMPYIFPTGSKPDDNPMFILAYNDVCSFTWTGENHIHQDIYECKTCGLTNSLCCCTECAYTCHRNHDCKIKRTSPTAYCDCWQKIKCTSLVGGNQAKRKTLFKDLLKKTNLINYVNSKGDHMLLFLAKTIGRQQEEQDFNGPITNRRPTNQQNNDKSSTPDSNSEPPKFAKQAMAMCLRDFNAVKSLLTLEVIKPPTDLSISDEIYFLASQSGCNQLDRFMFALLAKCPESHLDDLITTLINQHNNTKTKDNDIEELIHRLVRSAVRILTLLCVLSPQSVTLCITANSTNNLTTMTSSIAAITSDKSDRRGGPFQAIAISGMLSFVHSQSLRSSTQTKKDRPRLMMSNVILKCRRMFQALLPQSIYEIIKAAEALVIPLKNGLVKKSLIFTSSSNDAIENIEKYFDNEIPFAQLFLNDESHFSVGHRKRLISRRDGGEEAPTPLNENGSQGNISSDEEEGWSDEDVENGERNVNEGAMSDDGEIHNDDARSIVSTEELSSQDSEDDDDDDDDEAIDNDGNGEGDVIEFNINDSLNETVDVELDEEEDSENNGEDESEEEAEDDEETMVDSEQVNFDRMESDNYGDDETNEAPDSVIDNNETSAMEVDNNPLESNETSERVAGTNDASARAGSNVSQNNGESSSNATISRDPRRRTGQTAATTDNNTTEGGNANSEANSNNSTLARTLRFTDGNLTSGESHKVSYKAENQLAVAFATLIKVVNNLMALLKNYNTFCSVEHKGIPVLQVLSKDQILESYNFIETRLNPIWIWLDSIMDHFEAKIRYSQAVLNHPIGNHVYGSQITESDRLASVKTLKLERRNAIRNKNKRVVPPKDESEVVSPRREFMQYLLSILRSSSDENGDNFMQIDEQSMLPYAFIAEGYLSYGQAVENLLNEKIKKDQVDTNMSDNDCKIRDFFQRSSEFLYPGACLTAPFHSMKYDAKDAMPLAANPALLTPDADKSSLYGLPTSERTATDYTNLYNDIGIQKPAHQSIVGFINRSPKRNKQSASLEQVLDTSKCIKVNSRSSTSGPTTRQSLKKQKVTKNTEIVKSTFTYADLLTENNLSQENMLQVKLTRWAASLQLMARKFNDDFTPFFGSEHSYSVLINELSTFYVREREFKKKMDKTTNLQTKDLTFNVHRDPHVLIYQTFNQLNQQYAKRTGSTTLQKYNPSYNTTASVALNTPQIAVSLDTNAICKVRDESGGASSVGSSHKNGSLACKSVKVTFHNEPGEGSGVARSFYTALGEAFTSMKFLPMKGMTGMVDAQEKKDKSSGSNNDPSNRRRTANRSGALGFNRRNRIPYNISVVCHPFYPLDERNRGDEERNSSNDGTVDEALNNTGMRLLPKVREITSELANKVTGMILTLPSNSVMVLLDNEDLLRQQVQDCVNLLTTAGVGNNDYGPSEASPQSIPQPEPESKAPSSPVKKTPSTETFDYENSDIKPLFYKASKNGNYTINPGLNTPGRLNAFRNVGRLIGICLQQGEILPILLSRHIFKYILDKPINWYDFAFYDPAMFNSLRSLAYDNNEHCGYGDNYFIDLDMAFVVDLPVEEGGATVQLKEGGMESIVNRENVAEYIYLYVNARLLGKHIFALEALKQGVYDVLPRNALNNFNPEDLRLMLCGTHEINMVLMQSSTSFLNESNAAQDDLDSFKEMFWSVVMKLSREEMQDLLFFWTGTPTLPSKKEGFQPSPTVMIRPPENSRLPTANTCISRLYMPLYSNKKILKQRLCLAIKAKNFGFV
uniref:E3 ubiquitin-protein ligase UBR5 n=1 Tax=Parastrongyloides trichosuri TaxID=131310 RepID=A0A0N4ZYJ3_PARTI